MPITYKGCEIVTDEDFDGNEVTYVYMRDGGDPIEIIGGTQKAKRVIDDAIRDLEDYAAGNP